jgi:hypothetical protein
LPASTLKGPEISIILFDFNTNLGPTQIGVKDELTHTGGRWATDKDAAEKRGAFIEPEIYSSFSAVTGSTRVALRAGIAQAATAVAKTADSSRSGLARK